MCGPLRFEDHIACATTIPADWYTDPAMLERESERVFHRTWQPVGYTSQRAGPGDCLHAEVAGEPLLVVQGEDQALRAFSAVCRHRAGPVAGHPEKRGVLRCGYHGWTYGLDGRLLGTPDFEGVLDFDRETVALPPVRVETFASLVFVNLDATAASLADSLGSIVSETAGLELARTSLFRRADYEVSCNWKVYVDNYLEGYHISAPACSVSSTTPPTGWRLARSTRGSTPRSARSRKAPSTAGAADPTPSRRRPSTAGSSRT